MRNLSGQVKAACVSFWVLLRCLSSMIWDKNELWLEIFAIKMHQFLIEFTILIYRPPRLILGSSSVFEALPLLKLINTGGWSLVALSQMSYFTAKGKMWQWTTLPYPPGAVSKHNALWNSQRSCNSPQPESSQEKHGRRRDACCVDVAGISIC